MESAVRNLLYQRPELYEAVYDGENHAVPRMCDRLFTRYLGRTPDSLLDIGCGTGRDLEYLAKSCPDCVGVDYQDAMIDYARVRRPGIEFRTGDMRCFRLGRTFEAIVSFGYAVANVHANTDLDRVMATYTAHARPGTLLVVEVINTAAGVGGTGLPRRFAIDTPGFRADATAEYRVDARRQLLVRRRTWTVAGGRPVHDHVRFRLLYPKELEYYLGNHGFAVREMYDNTDLAQGDLTGPSLYVVARFRGRP